MPFKEIIERLREILHDIDHSFSREENKISLVIPALNEEKTVYKVISEAKKLKELFEIILVDDGSIDRTPEIAAKLNVQVIKHHSNMGKGEALRTGIANSKGNIIVFIDADWKNITSEKIRSLFLPILKNKADFTKASFLLKRGRVTEMAIKPIMKILYPASEFKQPISGQFAGRKEFLKKLRIEPRWGIDIAILLDAIEQGQRIVEVDVGEIIHKGRNTEEKAEMSRQVIETILKKSGLLCEKHKIIFFSDKTLFQYDRMTETSLKILKILRSKGLKIILLTTKEVNHKYKEKFDRIKKIQLNNESILSIAKNQSKSMGIKLKETILVANMPSFEDLASSVDKSFCFEKSPLNLKNESKIIKSLSELLLYIE